MSYGDDVTDLSDHHRRVAREIYRLLELEDLELTEAVLEEVRRLKQAQWRHRSQKG